MKKRYITHWHRKSLTRYHQDYNHIIKSTHETSARLLLEPAVPTERFVYCWLRNLSVCLSPFICSLRSKEEHIQTA
jgi:hypothetical protein